MGRSGLAARLLPTNGYPVVFAALDHPYVAAVSAAVARAHDGQPPLLVPALGGSVPDYVFTRILGLPSLLVPYANPDQRNHAPNENFAIDRFVRGIKTLAAVLEGLGAGATIRATEAALA